jgi:CheY-like chemotaxis protein
VEVSERPRVDVVDREPVVLVVEDDEIVRRVAIRVLKRGGFVVHDVGNGVEALEVLARERIDVLVTDTVMPRMGGGELAARVARDYPDVGIVMASGYTVDALNRQGPIPESALFIEKPYAADTLTAIVRRAFDARTRGVAAPPASADWTSTTRGAA